MNDMLSSARTILSQDGVMMLLQRSIGAIYKRSIRESLPKREEVYSYNGVKVPKCTPVLDPVIPPHRHGWMRDIPDYENNIIESIRSQCSAGDDVVIIGGGFGISAVTAAMRVGETGSVVVFEASKQNFGQMRKVIDYNNVEAIVDARYAAVDDVISLEWLGGNVGDADILKPDQLPAADVYELDCEGAEKGILERLSVRPETLIIETHDVFGVPKEETIPIINGMCYEITNITPEGDGCHVVTATYRG